MILTKNAMAAIPITSMVDDSRTFTVTKALAPPLGEIFDFRVSPAAQQGETLQVSVGIRNLGEQSGTFWARIVDRDTGGTVGTGSKTIAGGSTDWIYPTTFTMPNRDMRLRANIGHNTAVDDYMDKTIPLMVALGEIVNYDAPASAIPGDIVTVSATVKNVGTGSGSFQLRVRDRDENVDVDATGWFTMAAGASATKTLSGTMPDRDWPLTLLLERVLPTGATTVDDQKTFTAINIINWWTQIKAWWNGLEGYQKALIVTSSIGAVIVGGTTLKKG